MIKHALATIEHSAVGNHAMGINEALTNASIKHETYAETIRKQYSDTVKSMQEFSDGLRDDDVVLYQFANPSPMADLLYERNCRLIVNFHNITPSHYFSNWFPATSNAIARARIQLARLATVASGAIAVSNYNADELISLGYRNVEVIPPVFADSFYGIDGDKFNDGLRSTGVSLLFVGRIAPHKNIHHLIHAFDLYRTLYDENATLTIVGSTDTPIYKKAIDELIIKRDLTDSISIISNVSLQELRNIYQSSTLFVSLSEHEGFCVPLIEAMASGLPVCAYDAAAVGQTCGSAGRMLSTIEAKEVASVINEIVSSEETMDELRTNGFVRAHRYHPDISANEYVKYLQGWL